MEPFCRHLVALILHRANFWRLAVCGFLLPAAALAPPGDDQHPRYLLSPPVPLPMIQWKGTAKCEDPGQSTCALIFVREDGEVFPIHDNAELQKRVMESPAALSVQVIGKKTPKFLFWGNLLVVDDFKEIDPLAESAAPARF